MADLTPAALEAWLPTEPMIHGLLRLIRFMDLKDARSAFALRMRTVGFLRPNERNML
jgi:hypothetical protein